MHLMIWCMLSKQVFFVSPSEITALRNRLRKDCWYKFFALLVLGIGLWPLLSSFKPSDQGVSHGVVQIQTSLLGDLGGYRNVLGLLVSLAKPDHISASLIPCVQFYYFTVVPHSSRCCGGPQVLYLKGFYKQEMKGEGKYVIVHFKNII